VAATPSSCARCRLPAAPPSQMRVRTQYYPQYRATDACRISVCGRRLLRPLRVRQLLRVLSPCCAAAAVAERVTYGCVDTWIRKKYSAQIVCRCVPPRGAAQHQQRGCCAQQLRSNYQADNQAVTSVRTTRLVLWYYQADM
jgi:hypothetical protein